MKNIILVILALVSLSAFAGEYAVIVSDQNSSGALSAADVKSLYLYEKTEIGGQMLKTSINTNAAIKAAFLAGPIGMTQAEWDRAAVEITYTKGKSSKSFGSDAEVIAFVKEKNGQIGIVSKGSVAAGVKVLFSGSY